MTSKPQPQSALRPCGRGTPEGDPPPFWLTLQASEFTFWYFGNLNPFLNSARIVLFECSPSASN